ncbi:hypothetical protein DPMN_041615 [Dreissena polymorpha]|uniref:Uncharacterized protein n=1 Tax=Dreissena polymorpha TaxID=45954 RepID=A0A9D4CZQ9_DREPO|nr:hypothetical protein DPMN_041615 [Dreissena polymorpha]
MVRNAERWFNETNVDIRHVLTFLSKANVIAVLYIYCQIARNAEKWSAETYVNMSTVRAGVCLSHRHD